MLMKRILVYTFWGLFLLCGLFAACSQEGAPLAVEGEPVPLDLCAGGDALLHTSTRADNLPEVAFDATAVITARQGAYFGLTGKYEGYRDVKVGMDGSVSWILKSQSETQPMYPETGDWLYIVAVSPVAVPSADGKVSYTLTGKEDLLYASEIRGNQWDGDRFSGNTKAERNKPLAFSHLLTRLQFKACKQQTGGPAVKIIRVTVNEAESMVTLPLATGLPVFSGAQGLSLHPADDTGKEIPADGTAVSLGNLLLPPLSTGTVYTLEIETSMGIYRDIPIEFSGSSASENLQAGVSHEILLTLSDIALGITSVTVTPWELVRVDDDLELVP